MLGIFQPDETKTNTPLEQRAPKISKAEALITGLAEPSVNWPKDRSYTTVSRLHAVNTSMTLQNPRLTSACDFCDLIPENGNVLEIGPGNGSFLRGLFRRRNDLKLYAISTTILHPGNVEILRHLHYGAWPNDTALDYMFGCMDLVIDTYASVTYSENPLHAMLKSILFLKPGGTYTAITSTDNNRVGNSVLGDYNTRLKIKSLLREKLNLRLEMTFTEVISKISTEKNTIFQDLIVSCKRSVECPLHFDSILLLQLYKLVDQHIGRCCDFNSTTYQAGKYRIRMRNYSTNDDKPEQNPSSIRPKL